MTRFTVTHRPYRIAICVVTAALIAWSTYYYVQSTHNQQVISHIVDQYGEDITALASEQLTSSILNNDAISSQAIAHTIAFKTGVSSVIVYDNTHQILAQSIKAIENPISTPAKEYTAPILSSENIIGFISIAVNSSSFTDETENFIAPAVIIILLFCILFFLAKDLSQPQEAEHKTESKKRDGADTANTAQHKQTTNSLENSQADNAALTNRHDNIIYLTITIHNIDTLYRQLNGELRQQQMQLLERNVLHTVSLYHGKKMIADNDKIILAFNDNGKENITNAIYSARLLIALHQQCNKSMITMSGLIQESGKEKELNKTLDNVRLLFKNQTPYSTYIETNMIKKHQLQQYITYNENNEDAFSTEISGLTTHYQQLVDNQLTQLL